MAVRERRTTHWEWTCDGPQCLVMERVFVRSERPAGWLTMKVTDRMTLGFHERACAARYVESKLDDGLDKADPTIEAAEADMYGANA